MTGHPVFIEVAVTHLVDEAKREALSGLGVRCFEILLDPYQHESWTWDTLRHEVLECPETAIGSFTPSCSSSASRRSARRLRRPSKSRCRRPEPRSASGCACSRCRSTWWTRSWGLCLWWPYNDRVQAMLKAIAKSFGGRYKGAPYRNWVLPVGAKAAVLEQLQGIGAVREN